MSTADKVKEVLDANKGATWAQIVSLQPNKDIWAHVPVRKESQS